MADGITLPGTGSVAATDDCGAAGHAQIMKLAISTDGSATLLPGEATNGLDVDVTRLPALVAGTANIGDVDVLTVPADPFGANADAASATGSISAKLRFMAATGIPVTGTVTVASHAVTNAGTFAVQSTPVASELHLGLVHGSTVEVAAEVTRTADGNAYAVNDAVNNSVSAPTIITFAGAARVASGTGYITKARLSTDLSTCVAQIRLWLFSVSTPQLTNDNALFIIKYADKLTRIGYIDFPALGTETGSGVDTAHALAADLRLAFVADSGSAVYGLLSTKTAFTPASAQKFHLALTFEQN